MSILETILAHGLWGSSQVRCVRADRKREGPLFTTAAAAREYLAVSGCEDVEPGRWAGAELLRVLDALTDAQHEYPARRLAGRLRRG